MKTPWAQGALPPPVLPSGSAPSPETGSQVGTGPLPWPFTAQAGHGPADKETEERAPHLLQSLPMMGSGHGLPAPARGQGGHTYSGELAESLQEYCTFDLHHWQESTQLSLRFPTSTRVHEIRELLAARLKELGWLGASPYLLAPDTKEMLPCFLTASQVIALTRGPDPVSTPVDACIFFQILPPTWVQGTAADDHCCAHCRHPNEARNGSACHRAGSSGKGSEISDELTDLQATASLSPVMDRPGPLWQV
jgi:hypothetical protein